MYCAQAQPQDYVSIAGNHFCITRLYMLTRKQG
jgi:hypothetical protein